MEKGGRKHVHQGRVTGAAEDLVRVHRDGQVREQLHWAAGRDIREGLRYGAAERGRSKSFVQPFFSPTNGGKDGRT